MKQRIRAAWKVLRGEWTAHPPVQFPSVWIYNPPSDNQCSGSNVTVTYGTPLRREFNPRRSGRRIVHKHADALRRLAR